MAVDTFMAYVGVYPDVAAAEADYQLVKDLQGEHLPDDAPVGRRVAGVEALPLGHVRCSLRSTFAQPTHRRDRPGSAGLPRATSS